MSTLQRISIFAVVAVACHWGVGVSVVSAAKVAEHAEATPGEKTAASHGHEAASGEKVTSGSLPLGGEPDTNQAPIFPQNDEHQAAMIRLFVFTLVLFVVFLFAARKMLWQPMIEALDQRESVVNKAQAEAEAARLGAVKLGAEHEAKMVTVRQQIQEMIAQARKEAEAEKARIIADAEVQARNLRESAIADIHAARDQALSQLDAAVGAQVALATEHVVGHAIG
ncbi:MAG: ATP synthase F0 subunit B [Planctomycetaceae bacterium]